MNIFKLLILIGFALGGSATSVEAPYDAEADGWVSVERHDKEAPALGADETDPSIWVTFTKELGAEKFLVRFPAEPVHKYLNAEGSEMEIKASAHGSEYLLRVLAPADDFLTARKASLGESVHLFEKKNEKEAEIVYWQDGYWFVERLISTQEHAYILQTKNSDFESHLHSLFAASLNIEKK